MCVLPCWLFETLFALITDPLVDAIAKKHSKTTAQVLLRFATQRDICVIPKSSNFERLSENLACCGFALDEKDMAVCLRRDEHSAENEGKTGRYFDLCVVLFRI